MNSQDHYCQICGQPGWVGLRPGGICADCAAINDNNNEHNDTLED